MGSSGKPGELATRHASVLAATFCQQYGRRSRPKHENRQKEVFQFSVPLLLTGRSVASTSASTATSPCAISPFWPTSAVTESRPGVSEGWCSRRAQAIPRPCRAGKHGGESRRLSPTVANPMAVRFSPEAPTGYRCSHSEGETALKPRRSCLPLAQPSA